MPSSVDHCRVDEVRSLRALEHGAEEALLALELGEEVLDARSLDAGAGEEGLDRDVRELQLAATFAGEDEGLARGVGGAEVVAGIGLGVAELLGLPQEAREARAPVVVGEDVAYGPREHGLDADDAVRPRRGGTWQGGDDGAGRPPAVVS